MEIKTGKEDLKLLVKKLMRFQRIGRKTCKTWKKLLFVSFLSKNTKYKKNYKRNCWNSG